MPLTIREEFEKRERSFMSRFACPSSQSRGRAVAEEPCEVRTAFQLDRDRIVYSNAGKQDPGIFWHP
jgi:dGTPase